MPSWKKFAPCALNYPTLPSRTSKSGLNTGPTRRFPLCQTSGKSLEARWGLYGGWYSISQPIFCMQCTGHEGNFLNCPRAFTQVTVYQLLEMFGDFIAAYCQQCWQESVATSICLHHVVGNTEQLWDTQQSLFIHHSRLRDRTSVRHPFQ
jgi:hypothetical protein